MIHPERIAEVMGGFAILGHEVRSFQDLETSVAGGLPKVALRRVVPEATFKRRTHLSKTEGERTERLARVIAAAEYVWDDSDDAREWLTKPHPELSGRTPMEAAESELGARRVEHVLDSMFYGLPL